MTFADLAVATRFITLSVGASSRFGNFDRVQERVLAHWPPGDKWSTIGRCCEETEATTDGGQQLCWPCSQRWPLSLAFGCDGDTPTRWGTGAAEQASWRADGCWGCATLRRRGGQSSTLARRDRWRNTHALVSRVSRTLVLVPRAAKQTTSHCSCSGLHQEGEKPGVLGS